MSAVASAIVAMSQCEVPREFLIALAIIFGIACALSLPNTIIKLLGLDNNSNQK